MPTPFPQYVHVKDNYCCMYLGLSVEYIVALRLLKPQIEEQLPGLNFWIGCNKDFNYLLEGESQVTFSQDYSNFSYVREIRNNSTTHSIFELMKESNLTINSISQEYIHQKGLCLICPEGIEPTKSMDQSSIDKFTFEATKSGYTPIILGSDIHHSLPIKLRPQGKEKLKYIDEAKWIMGVENEYLFLGAAKGIKTTLKKTGVGHDFFRCLFPHAEIK